MTALDFLQDRAAACVDRIAEIRAGLEAQLDLSLRAQIRQDANREPDLRARLGGTTIYATGSLGRLEAGEFSDLDVFIASGALNRECLGSLENYELIVDLIRTARQNGFPPFSRDGAFLTSHSLTHIVGDVGTPGDDYSNTFTARMLLLLEGRCVYGDRAYECAVASVLERYWPAAEDRKLPVFLINDFVRYWRTLCLNYEGYKRTNDPLGKRRLDLLKLRLSRTWTCFSALVYLIAGLEGEQVPRTRVVAMVAASPLERMLAVAEDSPRTRERVGALVDLYATFLGFSGRPESQVTADLERDDVWAEFEKRSVMFGTEMHRLVTGLAAQTAVERFLLV